MRLRRLGPEDAGAFMALRDHGFGTDPDAFRHTARDDAMRGVDAFAARLAREWVVAAEVDGALVARGGFAPFEGEKIGHKGLIWGMYVMPAYRGGGTADAVMDGLLAAARGRVERLVLTVIAANARARAFYGRHGFTLYGVEPQAVRLSHGLADEALMGRRL